MPLQTINGKQIRAKSIEDKHIQSKLSEAVLDIDWSSASHAADILRNKVITDFVQLTAPVAILATQSSVVVNLALNTEDVSLPGVMLNTPLRFRTVNGEPLVSSLGGEVISKVTTKVGPGAVSGFDYTVAFFESDGTTPFVFAEDTSVEVIYSIKTTLWDAAESFAANERFIDGAVDIRSRLDMEQLAKDLFGDEYEFNANGAQTLAKTIIEQLSEETHGSIAETKVISATNAIDELYAARGGFENLDKRLDDMDAATVDLSSTEAGKGASLVGVEDSASNFTATTVEGVLAEIATRASALEKIADDSKGTKDSLDARLDVSLKEDGVLVDNAKIHKHDSYSFKAVAETANGVVFIDLATPKLTDVTLKDGKDTLEVYVNGVLQAETFHYALTKANGFITGVDFTPEVIVKDDIVTFKFAIYNE